MFHTVKVQKSVLSTISMEAICKIFYMYMVSYLVIICFRKDGNNFARFL